MVCQSWALQGYGTPSVIYLLYALKIALYIGAWVFFCSFTPGLGDVSAFTSWYAAPEAFQKAILWSIAFEGLGLGCGSGPLTSRLIPPITLMNNRKLECRACRIKFPPGKFPFGLQLQVIPYDSHHSDSFSL